MENEHHGTNAPESNDPCRMSDDPAPSPSSRPIPKRPDWLWMDALGPRNRTYDNLRAYIEHLEDALDERDKDLIRLYERIRTLENVR